MGAGLGPVGRDKTAKMVITFTGEITAEEADTFNQKLNDLLMRFRLNSDGDGFTHQGGAHVSANVDDEEVSVDFG